MVRDRSRSYTPHGNDLATGHVLAGADGLKDAQAGFVREGPGNALNLPPVHIHATVTK